MRDTVTLDELQEARGLPVYDSAGDKIGKVEEIYYDEQTNQPEWIGIGTGFLSGKPGLFSPGGAVVPSWPLGGLYPRRQPRRGQPPDVGRAGSPAPRGRTRAAPLLDDARLRRGPHPGGAGPASRAPPQPAPAHRHRRRLLWCSWRRPRDERVDASLLTIGDGLTVARKR